MKIIITTNDGVLLDTVEELETYIGMPHYLGETIIDAVRRAENRGDVPTEEESLPRRG